MNVVIYTEPDYNSVYNSLYNCYYYNRLYLSFQRLYRDALIIYNMLYNQQKIGVCWGWLRRKFTLSMFKTSASTTLKVYGQSKT